MEEYAKSRAFLNAEYNLRVEHSHKKDEYKNVTSYCEDILTFDIETTSFFYNDNLKPFLYKKGRKPEYWTKQYAGAIPYMWQVGINDRYYYGRDLEDFYKALADIPSDMKCIFWVHNLSFEFAFLEGLHFDYVFARSRHRPIKAISIEFPNIEFRCSYAMIDRSLEEWGEFLGIQK